MIWLQQTVVVDVDVTTEEAIQLSGLSYYYAAAEMEIADSI